MKKRPFWLTVVINSIVLLAAVADPDLQIRGGGEGGHPDPGIRKRAVSPKNFFRFLGPHFRQKIRRGGGGAGSPGPSHGFATDQYFFFFFFY